LNLTQTNKSRFFVIGAAKAGTTSLYEILKQHPDVFLPLVKEPHFYSNVKSANKEDYKQPEEGKVYHTKVISDKEVYNRLYSNAPSNALLGDFSPSYLWDANAAKEIHRDFPDAKIVVVLRNPIERAYSHYLMDVREGLQTETDFLQALQKDAQTEPKVWGGESHLYAELGFYAHQLERYELFPKEQIKIIVFETFFKDIEINLIDLYKFLELPEIDFSTTEIGTKSNTFAMPKNSVSAKLLQLRQKLHFISNVLPKGIKKQLKQQLLTDKNGKPEMSEEARSYLANLYEDDIKKLETKYQLDLSV